jgi:hypothetical protein
MTSTSDVTLEISVSLYTMSVSLFSSLVSCLSTDSEGLTRQPLDTVVGNFPFLSKCPPLNSPSGSPSRNFVINCWTLSKSSSFTSSASRFYETGGHCCNPLIDGVNLPWLSCVIQQYHGAYQTRNTPHFQSHSRYLYWNIFSCSLVMIHLGPHRHVL